jgi:hypothetical protein
MSCHRLTLETPPRFGLYSARPGADLFRRPPPRRRVDYPPAHHLRIRDRAVLRRGRRLLPSHDRRHPRQPTSGSPFPPGGDGGRPRLNGHAGSLRGRLGVAQLEVPAGRPRGGNHLCALDADPEARTGRRIAHRDSGLARGRSLRRRSPVRRGRDRSQRGSKRASGSSALNGARCSESAGLRTGGRRSFEYGRRSKARAPTTPARRRSREAEGCNASPSSSSGPAKSGACRWRGAFVNRAQTPTPAPVPRVGRRSKRGCRGTCSPIRSPQLAPCCGCCRTARNCKPADPRYPPTSAALGQAGTSSASRYSITRRVS